MTDVVVKQRTKRTGVVVSNKMDKTVVVKVERKFLHPLYKRTVKRHKKYAAHYEGAEGLNIGDKVEIISCRPLSKTKCWRVGKIIERAPVV